MIEEEAARRVRALMNKNGLRRWKLGIEDNRFDLGRTSLSKREIRLSREFIALNDWDEVYKTAIHEMAHAKVNNPAESHGEDWRQAAIALGDPDPEDGVWDDKPGFNSPLTSKDIDDDPVLMMRMMLHDMENKVGYMQAEGTVYF